ncbi:MAG TPA: BamA/TamA family outer membrane protein [Vicinamibacterales bacterium]
MALRRALAALLVLAATAATTRAQQSSPGSQGSAPPVSLYGVVPQDSGAPRGSGQTEPVTPTAVDPDAASTKRGEPVIAPLPLVNPTIGSGLIVIAGYLYRLNPDDHTTPPSGTFVGGFGTDNHSWGVMAGQEFHFGRDRVRVEAAGAYASVHYDFFGIGQAAGQANTSVPLVQEGGAGLANALIRVGGRWFAGAQYTLMQMKVRVDTDALATELPASLDRDVDLRTASLGPRIELDTRDNPFYARSGVYFNAMAAFYGQDVGGQRGYQSYQVWGSQYLSLGERQVLAWRASACAVASDVPFYDLCELGKSQDLRGYVVGQYRDRGLVAAQAEYRAEIWRFIGGTAFVGAGETVPAFDKLTWNQVLPGAGVGLRVTVANRNHVNIRADYAWGKNSHAFYVGVGEAF